ncbi:MAG: Holliday junction branch migration protein RuvA [Holosporales bacterium]|nr:Holliday junction branch migration protein RuvA [Holosporales bacterium]
MITKLYGIVDFIIGDCVHVCVHGVCYGVHCSKRTVGNLSPGTEVALWIEHIIRAESQLLCGFLTHDEQLLFREVTGVQGVGPKAGLSILSAMSLAEISNAIIAQDRHALTSADGVGNKMAERLIVELKNSKIIKSFQGEKDERTKDAVFALVALGYESSLANRIVRSLSEASTDCSTEQLVKAALVKLSQWGENEV